MVVKAAVPRKVLVTLFVLALGRLVAPDSSFRFSRRVQLASSRRSLLGLTVWLYFPKAR